MIATDLNLRSMRARKARLAHSIGTTGALILLFLAVVLAGVGLLLALTGQPRLGYLLLAAASICGTIRLWYSYDLKPLPPVANSNELGDRLSGELLALLRPDQSYTPLRLWKAISGHWQPKFIANHFLMTNATFEQLLSDTPEDMTRIWQSSVDLSVGGQMPAVEPGHVMAAIMMNTAPVRDYLTRVKHSPDDIQTMSRWLDRGLQQMRREKPFFGGIGRDWANGFTPLLNNFGHNLSLTIERSGGSYESLTDAVGTVAMQKALEQQASAIALIGDSGVGKTSYVYALAQALLRESASSSRISHKQIIELNSSLILSHAQRPGELEHIMISLMNETAHAGHIILFLDNASLFLRSGPGSFDATQILLPIVQAHATQIILAMTPNDYQRLRADNPAFATALTPVVLKEPDQAATMRILEDQALHLEGKHRVLIAHEALSAAYLLSGRYDQDGAYPGKAIRLLQQSIPYASQSVITAASVQQAIEKSHGVKVQTAAAAEADTLLHLEDKIHERMINQSHAVKVVASALRRARAGVSNPRRPIGSFLFLGPTGVGKTELAKSIAAVYFGSEQNMVRLDMSEYQQEADVQRLLSNGSESSKSLIMSVRNQPFSVVLLDEIEKAHPNILNLLLQLLDEGQLTDGTGRPVSFKDCIIIATSNAGANTIRERIQKGEAIESFAAQLTDELINSGQYKPELLNRFDEIVVFRPLNADELGQVVQLMVADINKTLGAQNIAVQLTPAAVAKIVELGNDPRLGARPIRRALQRAVEDGIAGRILRGEVQPGDHVTLDVGDLS